MSRKSSHESAPRLLTENEREREKHAVVESNGGFAFTIPAVLNILVRAYD